MSEPAAASGQPIIEVDSLSFEYAATNRWALTEIGLRIYSGEYVAILGPCGAGKTTLCLTLNGIVPNMMMGHMEGTVRVAGVDTRQSTVRDMARTVGMVFDNPEYQLSQMTAREEVALGMENLGVPREEMRRRIHEALRIVGLEGYEGRSPMALSGGQQQRLAIAAALAMYPEVLVLDEPTSNLDPIGTQEVFAVAEHLNRERGMTIVIAEQKVEVMARYADRIVVLDGGRIVLEGSPSEVFQGVERLEDIGIRVPQVTEMARAVERELALPHRAYPVTLDDGAPWFRRNGSR